MIKSGLILSKLMENTLSRKWLIWGPQTIQNFIKFGTELPSAIMSRYQSKNLGVTELDFDKIRPDFVQINGKYPVTEVVNLGSTNYSEFHKIWHRASQWYYVSIPIKKIGGNRAIF